MGTFYASCFIGNHVHRKRRANVPKILVDTGSEYTWISQGTLRKIGVVPEKKDILLVMANGQIVTRDIGFAIIWVERHFTIDEVIMAHRGDLELLGARSLEGLNLTVDPRKKKLVAAGPPPAAKG